MDDAEERARAGRAIRELGHAFVGHHAPAELLDEIAVTLDNLTARLDAGALRDRAMVRAGEEWKRGVTTGTRLESYDDRPWSGRSSPWGVDLEVDRHGDEIEARCTLRAAHEGAPGRSHGGVVAGLFDDVFGFVLDVVGEPAFTGELTIRYVAPTPLHREIACRGRVVGRDGRKLFIEGELVDLETPGQPVVARGTSTFITVDPSVFAESTAKLPAPPDEG
jgi:acyl-coenzyme A thioesterase PaaI-like protein